MNSVTRTVQCRDSTIIRRNSLLKLIYEFRNVANPNQRDEEAENEPGPTTVAMKKTYCQVQFLKNSINKISKERKQCKKLYFVNDASHNMVLHIVQTCSNLSISNELL